MTSQGKVRRIEWLLAVALVGAALLARLVPGERIVDDAYITFRYARNIVKGRGFVYNPGEHVLGTTTPLYTLLLAVVALVTGSHDFPTLAVVVNALAGAASVGLLYTLAKQVVDHWAPAAGAAMLWAVAPYSVTFAVGGMETDLTIALLLAVSYAHVTARPRSMATFSALAFLARPDTVILLGLLWLDHVLEGRRMPWREGTIGLGLLAPWLVFGTLIFGSPIPGSIAAKSASYRLSQGESLIRLIQHYSTPFFGHQVLGRGWHLAGFIAYLLLCGLGGLRAVRRNHRAWPLLAYPYAYLAVFAVANPLLFRWYLSPPLPFYFLFILAGVWTLAHDIGGLLSGCFGRLVDRDDGKLIDLGSDDQSANLPIPQSTNLPIPQSTILLFTIIALAFTLNAWELHPDHGPNRPAPEMAWFELELLYARAADLVLEQVQPGDTLCAGDIGVLGYVTDIPIRDTVGLVTPESGRYYPANPDIYVTNYAIPADLVLALDPDYVVILEVYGRRGLVPDPEFQDRYRLLRKLETDIYGSDGMLIFERVSL
jgi:hypothetical protein